MMGYAYRRLAEGMAYTLIIPTQEPGIRRFCLVPISLAAATLVHLYEYSDALFSGADVKISRATVGELLGAVEDVVDDNDRALQFWERLTIPLISLMGTGQPVHVSPIREPGVKV
jgi:farnesyl-diphosphate farnesyltransferase